MACLAIDTSSALTSVALDCGNGRVLLKEQYAEDSHSQSLQQLVKELIIESGLSGISDLRQLIVGLGPGSFTGLRISLSYLKGISWALKIPLIGVSSFLAVAKAQPASSVIIISDARRNEYFFASYKHLDDKVLEVKSLSIISKEALISEINHSSNQLIIIDLSKQGESQLPFTTVSAKGIALGLLKEQSAAKTWSLPELNAIKPIYLRDVAALTIEERRLRGWN